MVRKLLPRVTAAPLAAWGALYLALLLLRYEMVGAVDLSYSRAVDTGLLLGCYFDLLVSLYPTAVAALLWAAGVPRRITWPVVAFGVWFAGLANLLHTRFFGSRLDLWVVQMHWRDLTAVEGSAEQLAVGVPLWLSGAALLAGIVIAAVWFREPRAEPWTRDWKRRLVWAALLLLVCVGLYRVPRWISGRRPSDVISDNIVRVWVSQLTSTNINGGVGDAWIEQLRSSIDWSDPTSPSRVLAQYRDFHDNEPLVRLDAGAPSPTASAKPDAGASFPAAPGTAKPAAATDGVEPAGGAAGDAAVAVARPVVAAAAGSAAAVRAGPKPAALADTPRDLWPLERRLRPDPAVTRALRERLGLPTDGPIHVMLLFLESVRAFEVYHPEIGPELFPALRRVLATHAIEFRQAYSSSFTAGQTVRGQFSTLCSMLPNIAGAATYIAHTGVRLRCLQQVLRENGYETAWMNSHRSTFHGKRAFETRHGTDLFFDHDHFVARGITEKIGTWGLADEPFLLETLRLFEQLAAAGPVFANVLTISAHHPYSMVPQGPLPPALDAATRGHSSYRGYISRLRYEDIALSSFFDAFWSSPMADRTLIVLVADHSSWVRPPHIPLTHVQLQELRFRIPVALITRDMPHPEVIDTPVHQVDIAPTIARVVGAQGLVTWVGRGLFAREASPWVYLEENQLFYRTLQHGCYPASREGPMRCYDVTGRDPLFDTDLPEVAEPRADSRLFRRVIRANMQAIALDLVEPVRRHER